MGTKKLTFPERKTVGWDDCEKCILRMEMAYFKFWYLGYGLWAVFNWLLGNPL